MSFDLTAIHELPTPDKEEPIEDYPANLKALADLLDGALPSPGQKTVLGLLAKMSSGDAVQIGPNTWIGAAYNDANGYVRAYLGHGIYYDGTTWAAPPFAGNNGWTLLASRYNGSVSTYSAAGTGGTARSYNPGQLATCLRFAVDSDGVARGHGGLTAPYIELPGGQVKVDGIPRVRMYNAGAGGAFQIIGNGVFLVALDGLETDLHAYSAYFTNPSAHVSDQRVKDVAGPIDPAEALAVINALEPVTYLRTDVRPEDQDQLHSGFLAQAIEAIPELAHLVETRDVSEMLAGGTLDDLKTLRETELIAYQAAAIRELTSRLTARDETIADLAARVGTIESSLG